MTNMKHKPLSHLQRLALRDAGKLDDRRETVKAGGEHLKTTLESLVARGLLERRGLTNGVTIVPSSHRGWMTYALTDAGRAELLVEHWGVAPQEV
jgi:hypothetical protein